MTNFRYIQPKENEHIKNARAREMMESMKKEKLSDEDINFNKLIVTKHASKRFVDNFGSNIHIAGFRIKRILKKAKRIGLQIDKDGRESILYTYKGCNIYLTKDLSRVVTVNAIGELQDSYIDERVEELRQRAEGHDFDKGLKEIFESRWIELERQEKIQEQVLSRTQQEVNENIKKLTMLLKDDESFKPKRYDRYLKKRISEENYKIKLEARKLFYIKASKRRAGKYLSTIV